MADNEMSSMVSVAVARIEMSTAAYLLNHALGDGAAYDEIMTIAEEINLCRLRIIHLVENEGAPKW